MHNNQYSSQNFFRIINHQQKFHVEKFVFTKTAKSYVIHTSDTYFIIKKLSTFINCISIVWKCNYNTLNHFLTFSFYLVDYLPSSLSHWYLLVISSHAFHVIYVEIFTWHNVLPTLFKFNLLFLVISLALTSF